MPMPCADREWLTQAYDSAKATVEKLADDYKIHNAGPADATSGAIAAAREICAEALSALESHEKQHGCFKER